ncbi:hypothetical protein BGX38DRAFT_312574 [Terfezia claveryi]|nr:hypothetical protein BGX38DRAFT_312574 [Terfezia claveryi]
MIMVEYDCSLSHSRPAHYQTQPRDPHFQHLEHHSAPSTPSPPYNYAHLSPFAQQQQPSSVRSTPTSYPSPASYPSPSMPAYNYPPQQGHHSPHFQQMNTSNYSLPPMRMTPPNTTLPPPLQSGSPLPPPPQLYYTHGLGAPPISHITPSQQPLRYPLPQATQERIMSGGRHKKEIKRRTKTGCLTCRKRRIKCDEAHPTCKNCAKSKRECMGYDPIFKTQPGPAAIQPAPSSAGPTHIPSSTSVPYGVQNTAVGVMAYTPAMPVAGSSPTCEPYDYPVDPLLEASMPIPPHPGAMSILAETSAVYRPDLKRTYDRASPLSCISDTPRPSTTPMGRSVTPTPPIVRDSSANPAKRIKIDDLLTGASDGLPLTPPSGDQSLQPLLMASDTDLYRTKYAATLDALIETGWFKRNMDKVSRVGLLGEQFGGLCTRFQSRAGKYVEEEDPSLGSFCGDAEAYLDSIKLLYGTRAPAKLRSQPLVQEDDSATPSDIVGRNETIKRIAVVETLITGRTKIIDLCSPHVSPKSSTQPFGYQFGETSAFWRPLARFVSLKEGRDSEIDFETALKDMKNNAGGLPVRELLCTIADARHNHKKLQSNYYRTPETMEDKAKLEVIFEREKDVVMRNAHATFSPGGSLTDQLIRRISARAMALWGLSFSQQTFIL